MYGEAHRHVTVPASRRQPEWVVSVSVGGFAANTDRPIHPL
jgi:hypothetical protein